jgi:hypothetical protein
MDYYSYFLSVICKGKIGWEGGDEKYKIYNPLSNLLFVAPLISLSQTIEPPRGIGSLTAFRMQFFIFTLYLLPLLLQLSHLMTS